uniref:Uncharacterized protein n=1 Tax=Knipowitschia caucasica TaxID=637954 RepID=A0AAV2IZ28_KNICA
MCGNRMLRSRGLGPCYFSERVRQKFGTRPWVHIVLLGLRSQRNFICSEQDGQPEKIHLFCKRLLHAVLRLGARDRYQMCPMLSWRRTRRIMVMKKVGRVHSTLNRSQSQGKILIPIKASLPIVPLTLNLTYLKK